MKILDANMILRFLVQDNEFAADTVEELIESEVVLVLPEVISEVVYVMTKVYHIERQRTAMIISEFLDIPNVKTERTAVIQKGFDYYSKTSLDFVDCLLCAYHTVAGYEICTFDKKLNNLINREDEK